MIKPLATKEKTGWREPWPWLLAAGPLLVVVASLITAWIAISSSDGLVSDDYYRQGLAAQETIVRSEKASALGLVARVRVTANSISLTLTARDPGYRLPAALRVTLSHPTRTGLDQSQTVQREGLEYSGRFRLPASGHWLMLVEDDVKSWRMMGSVVLPANGEIIIGESLQTTVRHP